MTAATSTKRGLIVPVVLFGAALGIRAVYVAVGRYELYADAIYYYETAANLSRGAGYVLPDGRFLGSVPPAYPFFLAGVFKVFGVGLGPALWAQAVLGALAVAAIYGLARTLFDRRVAAVAGAAAAVHPFYVWASGVVLTETLTTLLLACGLWAYWRARHGLWPAAAAAGFALALTALCRPAFVAPGALMVAATPFFVKGRGRAKALATVAAALAFVVPLAGWAYRNYRAVGVATPLTLNAGRLFYEGNLDLAGPAAPGSGRLRRSTEYADRVGAYEGTRDADVADARFFNEKARALVARHPLAFAARLPSQVGRVLRPAPEMRGAAFAAAAVAGGVLLWAAWAGMLRFRGDGRRAFVLLAPAAVVVAAHAVIKPYIRFRIPVEFIFIIYAAAFAVFCYDALRRPRPG